MRESEGMEEGGVREGGNEGREGVDEGGKNEDSVWGEGEGRVCVGGGERGDGDIPIRSIYMTVVTDKN